MYSLFKENIPVIFIRINIVISVFVSLIVILFPTYIFNIYFLAPFDVYSFLYFIIFIFILTRTLIMKKDSTIIIVFTGLFILFVTYIMDVLSSNEFLPIKLYHSFIEPYTNLGILVFIYLHSIVLAINLSKTYNKLDDLMLNLEKEVKKQTEELIKANKKLKEIDSAKTVFFTNMNHELRTPLTLILSPLDSIIKGHYGDKIDSDDKLLKIILKNCYKLNKRVDDILDFIKIEENKMSLKKESIVINKLIKHYHEELNLLMKSRNIDFIFYDNSDKDISCNLDKYLFETAIMNIISNSYKFTERGGKITISLENDSTHFIMKIYNTGSGIPSDKIDKIFDRFNNIEYLPGVSKYGSGLGLSLTKKIVELHDGEIGVTSGENEGPCFTIRIPYEISTIDIEINIDNLKMTNLAEFDSRLIENDILPEKDKFTILAIDDNIDVLNYLVAGLKKDFNVIASENVRTALLILKEHKIDLALSDLMMEPEDGWDFVNYIKSNPGYENIPVIFLTAKNMPEDRINSLQKGVIDYITKPFLLDELILKIEIVLKRENKIKEMVKSDFLNKINNAINTDNIVSSDIDKRKKTFEDIFIEKKISDREKEIIHLIISGYQYKEIGHNLGISVNTVANHITKIYKKLGIQNKVELLNMFQN
jgi:signal transduction histidine kinase/DNA-binding NarL/FixJ family response regulator